MPLVEAGCLVLDCLEPENLAVFYKELLAAEETDATANRVEIRGADGTRLAFRRGGGPPARAKPRVGENATPPSWPRPENSLQVHLDFMVEDLDAVERKVVELGGRPLDTKDASGPFEERGYADPAGHSFTLRRTTPTAPKQG